MRGNLNPQYRRIAIPCEWCGEHFLVWPGESARRRFHSRACYHAAMREEAEQRRRTAPARFWANVDVRGLDDCWLWLAGQSQGYGQFYPFGELRPIRTHRFAFFLSRGRWPKGVCRHLCEGRYAIGDLTGRRCVNPAHLAEGTQSDNVRDTWEAGHYEGRRRVQPRWVICLHCGTTEPPFSAGRCKRCYNYHRRTGRDRPLP